MVVEFTAEVKNLYKLPGLVSLQHSKSDLTDPYAYLGNVLHTDKTLVVRYNPSIDTVGGGVTGRAEATSVNGTAIAEGGVALGGQLKPGAMAVAGNAIGANAGGDYGKGAPAYGGIVNISKGVVKGGRAIAGGFTPTQGKTEAQEGTEEEPNES